MDVISKLIRAESIGFIVLVHFVLFIPLFYTSVTLLMSLASLVFLVTLPFPIALFLFLHISPF